MTDKPELVLICPECGTTVEIADMAAFVRALHLLNDCVVSPLLAGPMPQ